MADNLKVVLNYGGVGKLLKSGEMQNVLKKHASEIAQKAGENFEVWDAPTRAVVQVRSKNSAGDDENIKNNTLLKAVRG